MREHIDNLRGALLKLPATGPDGFEGLLSATLTEISGVPFRLAGSGSQFGVDGKAVYEDDAVCFEAKLYDGQIPRNEVLTKIAELSIRDKGDIDLWVLGATIQVRAQLVDDLRELGTKIGIATLILDWSDSGIPLLAVALALAEPTAATFLRTHVKERKSASEALAALKAIRENDELASHAARLRTLLQAPTMGPGLAKQANGRWLTEVFSSKRQARRFLHQPLSPADNTSGRPAARDALVDWLKAVLTQTPDGTIVAVLGDEGNGKSWLVAQSWLSLNEKPLMVIFTADDFSETPAPSNFTETLINKLIAQTACYDSDAAHNRWRRKLERWRQSTKPNTPQLVVVIDGLNQRPQADWGQILDEISFEIEQIGGRLLITVRTAYYSSHVRRRLISPILELNVPEWTDAERDAILAESGVLGSGLRPVVAASLRNPRLLGIALELLESAKVQELEELNVSRLLFEHMRAHERDAPFPRPAHEFARTLQNHAREILDRVRAQKRDDLRIFDGGLEAVSDGRFFIPVEGDPTRYRLAEDGLTLALGFALLDELRTARRNGHDLADSLEAMIEPISALDRTAEAVVAALTVACLDEECPMEIGATIVGAFAELQNPNDDEFPAFAALSVKRPEVFMHAAHRMCVASSRQPNFDWIEASLHAAKRDSNAWSAMSPILRSWLGRYSLSPQTRMFSHPSRDPAEQVETERKKRQKEIDAILSALSDSERGLLSTLVRDDNGDLSTLGRVALKLLAGKPVAPFAMALANWSFANALNAGLGAPYTEFRHLVRLNLTDWREAREAILNACAMFKAADASRTGRWALVNLLRATGDANDAAQAEELARDLTADRQKLGGWRLIENYCGTDPCDPSSEKPDNIKRTAETYAALDVSKIRLTMGSTEVDHFFSMARPGIARFEAHIGINKHREFIANVLERNGFPLRQGVFEMDKHNALFTRDHAERLVGRVKAGTAGGADERLRKNERWIISQYQLILAFPLLTGSEQIAAMLSEHAAENILLELLDVAKPLGEGRFEAMLDKAMQDDDERTQFILLAFTRSTATGMTKNARVCLSMLAHSASARVRAQALRLIASICDEEGIGALVRSGWSASGVAKNDWNEMWYGSRVILESVARGMIPYEEGLKRIAPEFYGQIARRLGGDAARDVARLIDACIRSAADLVVDFVVPDIKLSQRDGDGVEPTRYCADERASASNDPREALRRLSESNEAFEERQERIRAAFDVFKEKVVKAKASVILDWLSIQEFDAIVGANRELAESWFDLFMSLPKERRATIHNLGLLLAHALANWEPDQAVRLFLALQDSEPFVRMTYGRAGITLEAMTLWSANDHPALDGLRFERLDVAENDDELALEVLAALWTQKQALLQAYIETRLQKGQPAEIVRALMVAGFSEHNEFNDAVLARYEGACGFIGKARSAAMYAYERSVWAEHWFRQMCQTEDAEEFWRFSVLFTKIVDGRFDVLLAGGPDKGEPFVMFWRSVEKQVANRCEKWRDVRKNKLFGDAVPEKVFLSRA